MRLGFHRAYLLSHPDHIKYVLQDNYAAYHKSSPAARIRPLFGDSLTTIDGDRWRRQRRLMRPAFQPQRLTSFMPAVLEATAAMLDRWQGLAGGGQPIDVLSEMTHLTRAIIFRVLFGDVAADDAQEVGDALDIVFEHTNQRLWSALGWLGRLPVLRPRRVQRALQRLDGFVARRIEEGFRRGPVPASLLSMLLEAQAQMTEEGMSRAQLHDEVKALLVAGHTTTASGLAWVWYLLAENPAAEGELQREIRTVLGAHPPAAADLPALSYTGLLIEEALRLYPPTWVTARAPLHDDEIGGYRIPANCIVLLSPFVTHRHPVFWEDPERFDPERFTPERSASRPRFAYFPFGGGPRACIGSALDVMEMQLVVAMVAQHFRLTLVPGFRVELDPGITLRPRQGIPMLLHRITPRPGP
jgi:cytochrome P450